MNRLIILIAFVLVTCASSPVGAQEMSSQDYLSLSRQQQTRGFTLLGVGAASTVIGALLFEENFCLWCYTPAENTKATIGGVMMIAGSVGMILSIPSFVNSSKNARKAATVSLIRENLPGPRISQQVPANYPAIRVAIGISGDK